MKRRSGALRRGPVRTSIFLVVLAASWVVFASPDGQARTRRRARRSRASHVAVPPLIQAANATPRDREIGQACLRALEGRRGSVLAMDPRSGRVIALVKPDVGLWRAHTPCSVFKVVVAIAGLSEGLITPSSTYDCQRGCWAWPGHGPLDLRRALAVSCNPYFQWVGSRLGYEKIHHYARLLGLGEVSGINLTGESSGTLPESVAPRRVAHLSSHATGIATSIAQVAVLLSATINGGVVYQPQIAGPAGFVPKERWRLPESVVLDGLADGFVAAVNEGSAMSAFDPDIIVAGKTGTCSRNGWFASYVLNQDPELVIVVLVRPGSGHQASAVAGRIYQDIYKNPSTAETDSPADPTSTSPATSGGF